MNSVCGFVFFLKTFRIVRTYLVRLSDKGLFVLQNVAHHIENNDKQNVDNG